MCENMAAYAMCTYIRAVLATGRGQVIKIPFHKCIFMMLYSNATVQMHPDDGGSFSCTQILIHGAVISPLHD